MPRSVTTGKKPKVTPQRKYQRGKKYFEVRKRYLQTPRGRFGIHKWNAHARGVPFELTFEQWLAVWVDSGHFDERGNKTPDGFVMARKGDRGAYAVGNVEIVEHRINVAERNRNYAMAMRAGVSWDWYKNQPELRPPPPDLPDPDVPF